ncbi:MAG: hypothetical protein COB76_05645 [Alphaproteobacteria bacterium]|nr:MAG: hypothetical protein COB76_05645 [Alphaproteobacteria bacterium]
MGCPAYADQDHIHEALIHSRGQDGAAASDIAGQLAETYGLHRQRHLTMGSGGYQAEVDYTKINGLSQTPCIHFTAKRHAKSSLNDNDVDFNFQMDLMAAAGAMTAELKDVILEISAMGGDLSVDQKAGFVKAVFNTYQLQQANEGRIELTGLELEGLQQSVDEYITPLRANIAIVETMVADNDNAPKAPKNEKILGLLDAVKTALTVPLAVAVDSISPVIVASSPSSSAPVKKEAVAAAPIELQQPSLIQNIAPSMPVVETTTSQIETVLPTAPVLIEQPSVSYQAPSMPAPAILPVEVAAPIVQQIERTSVALAQETPSFSAVIEVAMLQNTLPPVSQVPEIAPLQQELAQAQTQMVETLAVQTGQQPEIIQATIEDMVQPVPEVAPPLEQSQNQDQEAQVDQNQNAPEEIVQDNAVPDLDDVEDTPPVHENPTPEDAPVFDNPVLNDPQRIPDVAQTPTHIFNVPSNPVTQENSTEGPPQKLADPVIFKQLEIPSWQQAEMSAPPVQQQQPTYQAPEQPVVFKTPVVAPTEQPIQYKTPTEQPVIKIIPTHQVTPSNTGGGCAGCFTKACGSCGLAGGAAANKAAQSSASIASQKVGYDSFTP